VIILGIADGIDAGAAIIRDGKIDSAVNEERLSRIKLHMGDIHGFPINSIKEVLSISGLKPSQVDRIYIPLNVNTFPFSLINRFSVFRKGSKKRWLPASNHPKYIAEQAYAKLILNAKYSGFRGKLHKTLSGYALRKELGKLGLRAQLYFTDHHRSHAASAYLTSGLDRALVITMDSWGDGLSGSVSIGENGKIRVIKEVDALKTVGDFYSMITTFLGFRYHRHEGKITGLAAYGDPEKCHRILSKAITFDESEKIPRNRWGIRSRIIRKFKRLGLDNFSREDIAAATQKIFEDVIFSYIDHYAKETGIGDVCLAGGIFANVRLNQRVHESGNIDSVYIFPNMGDGGLAAGAGLLGYSETAQKNRKHAPRKLDNVYFGRAFSGREIREALDRCGLQYTFHKNIEIEIAKALSENKVVARFNGRMEFGPRALGNRSILYAAKDPTVNDWLNNRLGRTEFMPFAPVTLKEHVKQSYKNTQGGEYASNFMTITFNCSERMRRESPAVVHLDNTARPQVISKETNPSYYRILEEYHKLTGIPTIVNTSYNMHEEPIVNTPDDAIRSFLQGHLDILAMGNYMVRLGV
jgi:carbamoyltransferase